MRWLRQGSWPLYISILFGIVVTAWQWYAINPDGIAYSDIAGKWAHGRFYEAINAYWSPFWSWLLVPFLWLGLTPLAAIRLLELLLLFFALIDWKHWLQWLAGKQRPAWLPWLELAGGINLAYYAQAISGPDLLATLLVLHFVRLLISDRHTAYMGILLGIMFLTKVYLLYFGILASGLALIYRIQQGTIWAAELRRVFSILSISLLFIVPWIAALNYKYGNLSLGSSGKYNAQNRFAGGIEHPWKNGGLIPPPDEYSTFVWTDITTVYPTYQRLQQQKPASVIPVLSYNVKKSVRLLMINCAFTLFAFYFLVRHRKKKLHSFPRVLILTALAGLYLAGYQLFSAEHRYFWPVFMIGISLPVLWMDFLPKRVLFTGGLCLLLTIPHSLVRAFYPRNGLDDYKQAVALLDKIPPGSRIASWKTRETWFISFHNRYRDYGGLMGEAEVRQSLAARQHQIQFVLFQSTDLASVKAAFPAQTIDSAGNWYYLTLK
ncbi:MAG: hypothetical protein JNL57_13380 [Bacteroidetes bacterium]|nr:hypothetical protein [Bacteroidota bacterium]